MANKRGNFSPSFNRLSDRDMLLDLLVTEKYMSHLYDHAIMEASGYQVRDTFIALQQEEHETAQMLFDFMHRHGWYTTGANRQKQGRRLQSYQPLSGGRQQSKNMRGGGQPHPKADSRYAVASGSRRLGQSFADNRGHVGAQPAWNAADNRNYDNR